MCADGARCGDSNVGKIRKTRFAASAPYYTSPLHVVTPWPVPWLTWRSAELTRAARIATSQAIAGARRAHDILHLLLTVIGRHACFWFLRVHSSSGPCPHHSNAIRARPTRWSVRGLLHLPKGTPTWRAVEMQKLMSVGGILCAELALCACRSRRRSLGGGGCTFKYTATSTRGGRTPPRASANCWGGGPREEFTM